MCKWCHSFWFFVFVFVFFSGGGGGSGGPPGTFFGFNGGGVKLCNVRQN